MLARKLSARLADGAFRLRLTGSIFSPRALASISLHSRLRYSFCHSEGSKSVSMDETNCCASFSSAAAGVFALAGSMPEKLSTWSARRSVDSIR
jgi:hypothetical protein